MIKNSVRGLQASLDLVENSAQDTITGLFLGYKTLAPGSDNAMNLGPLVLSLWAATGL